MPTNTYGSRCRAPGGTMTTGWNRPGNSRVSDMRPIRRILVAVRDPAAGMTPAVVKAAQLARALRAELELFHGITTPLYVDRGHRDQVAARRFAGQYERALGLSCVRSDRATRRRLPGR